MKRAMIANAAEVVAVSSAEKLGSAAPYVVGAARGADAPRHGALGHAEQLDPYRARGRRGGAGLMRGTRLAIRLFFFGDGLLIGSWAARIPAVQQHAELTNARLGLALFAISLGALSAMPLAGRLGERIGSRRRHPRRAAASARRSLVLASLAGGLARLAAALFALRRRLRRDQRRRRTPRGWRSSGRYGRSILSSFHAAFSAGGLAGAGARRARRRGGGRRRGCTSARSRSRSRRSSLVGGRSSAPAGGRRRAAPTPASSSGRRGRCSCSGAAAFCTMLAEGAAADWSAVYLSHSLGAARRRGRARLHGLLAGDGDEPHRRRPAQRAARAGGARARRRAARGHRPRRSRSPIGSTPSRSPVSPRWAPGSASSCRCSSAPLARRPASRRAPACAAVSTIGWLGFLAGPPAIGFAAGAVGLRTALGIVVVATAWCSPCSRAARARTRAEPRSVEPVAVLSDLDGVLVDSGAAIEATWRRFAERHGLDPEHVLAAEPRAGGRPT